MEEDSAIVIDNGSGSIKCGFGGDEWPKSTFPTVVGRPSYQYIYSGTQNCDTYIGKEATNKAEILNLTYPIEHGVITNWDDMEKIWRHDFEDELKVDQTKHTVLFTEPVFNPKSCKEKTIQIMFETFNVPAFYMDTTSVFSFYASGRTTGVVLELGHGVTSVTAINEDLVFHNAAKRLNFGGVDLTEYLQKILKEKGYTYKILDDLNFITDIKENQGYVAADYDKEVQKAMNSTFCDKTYEFSDQSRLKIGLERFNFAELLFKPQMNGFSFEGIHKILIDSINKCDIDILPDLYKNIVLSGGSAFINGLVERLEKETMFLAPQYRKKFILPPEHLHMAWIGGSIFSSIDNFPKFTITRDKYNEVGKSISIPSVG